MDKLNNKYLDFTKKPEFSDILTNPILDIAARFWEEERYKAFKVCYRSMRVIDDLVDDRKEGGVVLSESEIKQLEQMINIWLESFSKNLVSDDFQRALLDIKNRFNIPIWPWSRLAKAMIYDLHHDSFDSFLIFLRYSEGAAISPASIFMHLCGVKKENDSFKPPIFDIRDAARTLALFSYIVHIIRDFQKDQLRNLNYYASNQLTQFNLTQLDLRSVAEGGTIGPDFRSLMGRYHTFAEYYQKLARKKVDEILPLLEPPYQLSLEMIYQLYSQIFERIDVKNGSFTENELLPAPDEVKSRINRTIERFQPKN